MNSFGLHLFEYMDGIEVVDTHEHLSNEEERISGKVDFSKLFSVYTSTDLLSAGMTREEFSNFCDPDTDIEIKWKLFEYFYKKIKNGSYCRAARISMKKFYGLDDLENLGDAVEVSERMRQENKPGLYEKVLKDVCKLYSIVNFIFSREAESKIGYFAYVEHVTRFCEVSSLSQIDSFVKELGERPVTLEAYVAALHKYLHMRKQQGLKGIKFHSAYNRELFFQSVTTADAEKLFNRIYDESIGKRGSVLGFEESIPLQDYLVHRIVDIAGEEGLPVVFHSGFHGWNHKQENSRPLKLWNLFNRYHKTKFIILHAGIPWIEECCTMAKYFHNVYLDMAWAHLISPELSVRGLKVMVDTVPQNKILGFGGDQLVVEKVYGHLQLAKTNIARALSEKAEDGSMTENDAYIWAKAILLDNPIELYQL